MIDNQFDEFFRNRLQGLPSEVPGDMWSRIQQKKKKDRKIVFFWRRNSPWLLVVLALLGSGFYLWVWPGQHTNTPGKHSTIREQHATTPEPYATNPRQPVAAKPATDNSTAGNPVAGNSAASKPVAGKPAAGPSSPDRSAPGKTAPVLEQDPQPTAPDSPAASDKPSTSKSADPKLASAKTADPKPAVKKDKTPSSSEKSNWFLDIYGSPDLAFSRWKNNDSLGYIKSILKTKLSYTVGARVSRSFGEHFSAKIGLQYSVINEWYMPDPNGSVFHKRIKSIDIPVLVGYAWGEDEFRMAVNTGMIFNTHTWYSSAPADSIGDLYKSYLGTSIYLGFDVARSLNDQIQLFAEPYYKYRLSQMMRPELVIGQKIDVFGILLGARYNFKKSRQHK